ncbi:MAG TPA: Hpt domain-containing protein [Victivallales bacterium]|nr:Hpt domain-containing protein [Victivallales bacterium]HPO89893.1 Hpt domain-containing protein [Victivallales bacterium]HRR05684.1 Hpt domain-containing protein [Victivallales bacterium]HRR28087.1 Hpt domain-containing protein [Victivallales bacterium]HRU01190.1 Hpt domain-containing protein [Victivallales bacterium]
MEDMNNCELKILNKHSLLERLMGDKELISEILKVFLEDAPRQIQNIKISMQNTQIENARDAAHSLKGAAGNIGAEKLYNKARDLEYALRDKNLNLINPLLAEVERLFNELKTEIQNFLSEG